jgi:hypothetical protein
MAVLHTACLVRPCGNEVVSLLGGNASKDAAIGLVLCLGIRLPDLDWRCRERREEVGGKDGSAIL